MQRPILAPSLLSADFSHLRDEFTRMHEAGVQWVHLDIMDNCFVSNLTFGPPVIEKLRPHSSALFDAHLMVQKPETMIEALVKAGCDAITIHPETTTHVYQVVQSIRQKKIRAGIAILPATPVELYTPIFSLVDIVVVMLVNPGFSGQEMIPDTVSKIRELVILRKSRNHTFLISVDGGVTTKNASQLLKQGADILISGSEFFHHPKPSVFVQQVQKKMTVT